MPGDEIKTEEAKPAEPEVCDLCTIILSIFAWFSMGVCVLYMRAQSLESKGKCNDVK